MSPLRIIIRIILLLVGLIVAVVEASPDTTVVQAYCDQNSWQYGFYDETVPAVLDQVAADASADQNYVGHELMQIDYYNPNIYIYAYGECSNTAISSADCYDCLCAAASQLSTNCYDMGGGVVKMADCMMEYDNYDLS